MTAGLEVHRSGFKGSGVRFQKTEDRSQRTEDLGSQELRNWKIGELLLDRQNTYNS